MTMAFAGDAIVGQRDGQEDAFRIVAQDETDASADLLLMVADGMGGHAGGEVASKVALQTFEQSFVASRETRPGERLRQALDTANAAVARRMREEPALEGMGCTLVAALRRRDRLHWLSIGDSLLFRHRGGRLERLNADHSLLGQLMEKVARGDLTEAEARAHPKRNALRSAVMGGEMPLIDIGETVLQKGDLILLATDGIETLGTPALGLLLGRAEAKSPGEITREALSAVIDLGHPRQDNTTVITYRHDDGGAGVPALAATGWRAAMPSQRALAGIGGAVAACVLLVGLLLWLNGPDDEPAALETGDDVAAQGERERAPERVGGAAPVPRGATPQSVPPATGEADGAQGAGRGQAPDGARADEAAPGDGATAGEGTGAGEPGPGGTAGANEAGGTDGDGGAGDAVGAGGPERAAPDEPDAAPDEPSGSGPAGSGASGASGPSGPGTPSPAASGSGVLGPDRSAGPGEDAAGGGGEGQPVPGRNTGNSAGDAGGARPQGTGTTDLPDAPEDPK